MHDAAQNESPVDRVKRRPGPRKLLTPMARTTLTADIRRKLVTQLIRGDWGPGERLPTERELCQQLDVGRASLREALKSLETIGMIETRLGDGTYVCERREFLSRPLLWAIASSSENETRELVEARKLIEVELAGFAAERATTDNLKKIGDCLDEMEDSTNDVERFLQADIDFHLAVGEAAHNRILMTALLLIRNLLREWIGATVRMEGIIGVVLKQHQQIFLAIAKKKRLAARSAMEIHLEEMGKLLLASQKESAEPRRPQERHPAELVTKNLPPV